MLSFFTQDQYSDKNLCDQCIASSILLPSLFCICNILDASNYHAINQANEISIDHYIWQQHCAWL